MAGDWDEAKHPRADDGKFGEGGGGRSAAAARLAKAGAERKAKRPANPEHEARIAAARESALKNARDGYEIAGMKIPPKPESEHAKYADDAERFEREAIDREIKDDEAIAAHPHLKAKMEKEVAERGVSARDAAREVVREHEADRDADAAEKAGHIKSLPEKELKAIEAGHTALVTHLEKAAEEQDETARAAFAALSAFNADDNDDAIELPEEAAAAVAKVAEDANLKGKHGSYDDDDIEEPPDVPEAPEDKLTESEWDDLDDSEVQHETYGDYEKAHDEAAREHAEALSKRDEFRKAKALEAQKAFTKLHAQQVKALADAKALNKAGEAVKRKLQRKLEEDDEEDPMLLNHAAFKDHERADEDDDGYNGEIFADPDVEAAYERARKGAIYRAGTALQGLEDMARVDMEDHVAIVKDGIAATAATIRALSKITKVKAVLGKAVTKADDDEDEE